MLNGKFRRVATLSADTNLDTSRLDTSAPTLALIILTARQASSSAVTTGFPVVSHSPENLGQRQAHR